MSTSQRILPVLTPVDNGTDSNALDAPRPLSPRQSLLQQTSETGKGLSVLTSVGMPAADSLVGSGSSTSLFGLRDAESQVTRIYPRPVHSGHTDRAERTCHSGHTDNIDQLNHADHADHASCRPCLMPDMPTMPDMPDMPDMPTMPTIPTIPTVTITLTTPIILTTLCDSHMLMHRTRSTRRASSAQSVGSVCTTPSCWPMGK